ncbi:hypothetical protein GCM10009801_80120 [Streptomyces albiaxialis]|uniref:Uncharacterized protein n=1 Tax=Streptomyces albiaxialis TaxID=329523 RepID=A0ABP5IQC1_9ACTN
MASSLGAGGSGCVREALGESGDRLAVSFKGFAFVVGQVDLFEHLVDAVPDGQELTLSGLFRDVERAACAGRPVGALGEEVIAAVALAQVVEADPEPLLSVEQTEIRPLPDQYGSSRPPGRLRRCRAR